MIEPFPLPSGNQNLTVEDFQRFSYAFADIVSNKIPTAKHIRFIFNEKQLKDSLKNEDIKKISKDKEKEQKVLDKLFVKRVAIVRREERLSEIINEVREIYEKIGEPFPLDEEGE